MRWQAPVVFLFLSCDRSQHRHDVSCMGSSEEIVRTVSQVKAAPTMQSQRAQESQHRAASARQAFRALSAGVFASGRPSKKDRTLVAQPASQREPCMAQEHGRNTLSARAKTINAAKMASFQAHCQHALRLKGSPIVGLCSLPKAWHSYPRLLHLARVLQHGPDWLWSLIQSQVWRQWRECVFLDLEFMARPFMTSSQT